jgi:uncharacterized protein
MTAVAQHAAADVAIPPLSSPVTDLTQTLTREQAASLEQTLRAFEQRKGSQIAVLLVPTTQPESIEQYSIRVAEAWKIGRKGIDDGVIFLIAKDDRALRIEVGYGLEGALPDAVASRIIRDVVTPQFRSGDFYGGIAAGVDRIIRTIDGEPLPEPVKSRASNTEGKLFDALPVFLMAVFVVGGILRAIFGRLGGAAVAAAAVAVIVWLLIGTLVVAIIAAIIAFIATLVGGGGGGWSSGRRSGWGGGGFGGGWSGGGGGFGGGGASGRW